MNEDIFQPNELTADTNEGSVCLRPGIIDSNAKTAFSNGQCHSLALAIRELTGWELIGFGRVSWNYGCCPRHTAILMPDKRVLDIKGTHSLEDMVDEWGEQENLMESEVRSNFDGHYRQYDTELAKSFAVILVERYRG